MNTIGGKKDTDSKVLKKADSMKAVQGTDRIDNELDVSKGSFDLEQQGEKGNTKRTKRMALEEEKELRIQEFLAAKKKEYIKYEYLEFDYQVVEKEIAQFQQIDYSQLNPIHETMKLNHQQYHGNSINQSNLNDVSQILSDQWDREILKGEKEIIDVVDRLQIYITPLQDNFALFDENLRTISADNMQHSLLGVPKFCGTVFKKGRGEKSLNEEMWVVVRGFYIFVYTDLHALRPMHLLRIPIQKLALSAMPVVDSRNGYQNDQIELQYFSILEKQDVYVEFFIGKNHLDMKSTKSNFYDFVKNQIAVKTYLILCGYLNITPDRNLLTFFETDQASILKINFAIEIVDSLVQVHPILKKVSEAFFYYTFVSAGFSKNLIAIDFNNLNLWSKFLIFFFTVMKEEQVTCPIQILKLDSNDITEDVLIVMNLYLLESQSFFLKHLSLNNTCKQIPQNIRLIATYIILKAFGDKGCQMIGRMITERHTKIRSSLAPDNMSYQLPLEYLGLQNVQMGDLGLYNIVISLEKVSKENQVYGIVDYDSYMQLHFGQNNITEKSLNSLGTLLYNFQGVSVLNICESKQIICISTQKFFEQLKNNYSLTTLDISKIEINVQAFTSLVALLEDNYTLQTIRISLNQALITEISRSKNSNLLKNFMISYNPNLIFENI